MKYLVWNWNENLTAAFSERIFIFFLFWLWKSVRKWAKDGAQTAAVTTATGTESLGLNPVSIPWKIEGARGFVALDLEN